MVFVMVHFFDWRVLHSMAFSVWGYSYRLCVNVVCACVHMYVCNVLLYVTYYCMYVCIYVHTYVYMYVCACTYVYTCNSIKLRRRHCVCFLLHHIFVAEASLEWRKKESRWRRAGVLLYQSEATMCVLERLEVEIEAGRLGVRKDCCVESDLGLRQRLLDMLFCYNPVWLKLGLEVCRGDL